MLSLMSGNFQTERHKCEGQRPCLCLITTSVVDSAGISMQFELSLFPLGHRTQISFWILDFLTVNFITWKGLAKQDPWWPNCFSSWWWINSVYCFGAISNLYIKMFIYVIPLNAMALKKCSPITKSFISHEESQKLKTNPCMFTHPTLYFLEKRLNMLISDFAVCLSPKPKPWVTNKASHQWLLAKSS